jgi:hypothetical protein
MRPTNPLHHLGINALPRTLFIEEQTLLMRRVFGTSRDVCLGEQFDVWMEKGGVERVIELGRIQPFY